MKGSRKLSRLDWGERVFWGLMTLAGVALAAAVLIYGRAVAAELGFSNRVLHDVPSPDARYRAVCQEVPAFDGPGYSVRLLRADGVQVRGLWGTGDGDPCHELVWSGDSRYLAIVSTHVGRVVVIDVHENIRRLNERVWPRMISLTWPEGMARNLTFPRPGIFEFDACDAKHVFGARRTCGVAYDRRRMDFFQKPVQVDRLRPRD